MDIMDMLEKMADSAEAARKVAEEEKEACKIIAEQEKIEKQRRVEERQERDKNISPEELEEEADKVAKTFLSQMIPKINRNSILDVRNGPDSVYKEEEIPADLVDPELFISAAERFIEQQNESPGSFKMTVIGNVRREDFMLKIEKRTEEGGEIK